jgi:hypothetical protein
MAHEHLNRDDMWRLDRGDAKGKLCDKLDQHDDSLNALDAGKIQKRTVTIGHADLTDAVNGEAQAINIGAVLPANARIIGRELTGLTEFSGGSVSAVTLSIGGTDADCIVAAQDVFTGAGVVSKEGTSGVNPNGNLGGQQLKATFTPDAGHALDALTAGAVTITVLFAVLA